MGKKLLCYFFFIFSLCLHAQNKTKDSTSLKASLSLTGFYQGGNVQTLIFRAKGDLGFGVWPNGEYKTQNSYIYQAFDKEKADEDILSLNFLRFNPNRQIYPFVLAFLSTNYRRAIDLRYLVGGGITFQIARSSKSQLKLSLSSEYENTKFSRTTFNYSEYNDQNSINTLRATVWIKGKYQMFKNKIIFSHESYFQPSLARANNFRWQMDMAIEIPVIKYLDFKINYRYAYENIVIIDQKKYDDFLTFGFTIKTSN